MIGLRQLKDLSRADFLTSVGLYVASDRLFMVRLRKSFLTLSMLDQEQRGFGAGDSRQAISELTGWVIDDVREIALRAESDTRERALRQAIVSLLPHINAARDQVYICLPQEQAIVQQVFLPVAAQDNLQYVLDYEIERQLPFKRDEIYYDYLPGEIKGEKLSVYVFAIPKKILDTLLTTLESLGIKPSGVETTVTALANYVLFADEAKAKSAAVITGHPNHWELVGVEAKGSGWASTAELLFSHRLPTAAWAQNAGQELLQKCLREVPKLFHCGDITALNGAAGGKIAQAEDVTARVNPRLAGLKTGSEADEIPAIGAALHGVREGFLRVNFLRHEASDAKGINHLSVLNTVLLALLVISVVAWGVSFPIKDELRLRELQQENRKFAPAIEALRREEEQHDRLRKELSFFNGLEQRRGEVLRILDELTKIIPNSAYLSNLRYRSGLLEIQGNAENASALIPLLERSPVFENVGFNAPSNRGRDNRETFSLKTNIEKPKEVAKEIPKSTTAVAPSKDTKAKP